MLSKALLTVGERDRLDDWSNRALLTRPQLGGATIAGLFADQVARSADAVAVTFEGRSWTYRELDLASNRLAHLLVGLGAAPGEFVAVMFPRSATAVIAILAVLKAGAGYLPIDPAAPDERIEFMIGDAGAVLAVIDAESASRVASFGVPVVEVDDPRVATQSDERLRLPDPDDVAHLIYTSGTTGRPKGVAVTHRNVTRLFDGMDVGVDLGPDQVWTQCHSLAFDYSVWELWGALLHGGRLVVVSESVAASPADLHALVLAEGVTVLSQTPTAVWALSDQGLESVALMVAGEECPADVVDRWAPGRVMINGYGPTETTVYATISRPLTAGSGVVPIGVPVPGAALFVLDGLLRPVSVGVVGELYVAGWGVALGYVGR
ncbi:AMP-binding protein, partial [Mycobacterium sp. NPDC050041]|uniref:AMP-binding protein n=1 Tax=Mycobacterium sp. NPDC050041 TaxID=3364293 RepID=UPI003C2C887F